MPTLTLAGPVPFTPVGPPPAPTPATRVDLSNLHLDYALMVAKIDAAVLDAQNNRLDLQTVSAPFAKADTQAQIVGKLQAAVEAKFGFVGTVLVL